MKNFEDQEKMENENSRLEIENELLNAITKYHKRQKSENNLYKNIKKSIYISE